MTVDPRTLAADLRAAAKADPADYLDTLGASAELIERVVVPLHVAWLQAKPPCPTCGGMNTCIGDGVDCPDCDTGVLPFDKWTAGLVALWTAVHDELILAKIPAASTIRRPADVIVALRKIGGAR